MRAEQERFYQGLRRHGKGLSYFGFDVDPLPGGGYSDIRQPLDPFRHSEPVATFLALPERVRGEGAAQESERLRTLLRKAAALKRITGAAVAAGVRCSLAALIDSLSYIEQTIPLQPTIPCARAWPSAKAA